MLNTPVELYIKPRSHLAIMNIHTHSLVGHLQLLTLLAIEQLQLFSQRKRQRQERLLLENIWINMEADRFMM